MVAAIVAVVTAALWTIGDAGSPDPTRAEAVTVAGSPARYVPLAQPRRLVDSRSGLGTERGPWPAGTSRDLAVTGAIVPETATAVLLNVTAANIVGTGWLQVLPTGRAEIGSASTLNVESTASALPNAAFAPLGDGGRITVHRTFRTDVIIDVFGFFVPATASTDGRFVPLTPARLLDTRQGLLSPGDAKDCTDFIDYADAKDWYDAFVGQFGDVARLDDDNDGLPCELLPGAPAPPPTPATAAPTPAPAPTTTVGRTTPTVGTPPTTPTPSRPPDPGNSKNCTDFPDWAAAWAWYSTYALWYGDVAQLDADNDGIPCETLRGAPNRLRPVDRVPRNTTITLPVAGQRGVPASGVGAVVLNVTAVEPVADGYVQVAPTPVTPGSTSNLNTTPGVTVANLVVVPLSPGGSVDLYSFGPTDLVVDVLGYFTDSTAASSATGLFVAITPDRRLDTRALGARPGPGTTKAVDVTAIDPTASAIAGNLTATEAVTDGWVQVAATPVTPGASSNLNIDLDGQTIANAVVSPVAAGRLDVHTFRAAHLLLDVTGWFTGPSTVPTPATAPPTVPATAATTPPAPDTTTTTLAPTTTTTVSPTTVPPTTTVPETTGAPTTTASKPTAPTDPD